MHDMTPISHDSRPDKESTAATRLDPPLVVENGTQSAPESPHAASRAALLNLTLPTVPNLDIPPSPPGSPPAAMNQKVKQLLELKKQDVHFNEKLAHSSAMKNPSLLGKLMTFAGLDQNEQYATTLSSDLWDPRAFPTWAYKDELAKAQQEAQRRREEDRTRTGRSAADFVAASAPENSSRSGTQGGKDSRPSAADRVMAGLSRDRERPDTTRDRSYRRRSRSPPKRG